MRNIFIGTILFLSVVAQTSFFPNLFPGNIVPDVALMVIIFWISKADFNSVFSWTILGGFFVDMLSFLPIGVSIFSFMIITFAAHSLSKRFLTNQRGWKFSILSLIVIIGTILNFFITTFLLLLISETKNIAIENGFLFLYSNLFLKSIYNLIIFVAIYWLLEKANRIFMYQNNQVIIRR